MRAGAGRQKSPSPDPSAAGRVEIDIKKYAKVEKIPGGDMKKECRVIDGVMLNKDVVHAQMKRTIKNPRVLLMDCPLESVPLAPLWRLLMPRGHSLSAPSHESLGREGWEGGSSHSPRSLMPHFDNKRDRQRVGAVHAAVASPLSRFELFQRRRGPCSSGDMLGDTGRDAQACTHTDCNDDNKNVEFNPDEPPWENWRIATIGARGTRCEASVLPAWPSGDGAPEDQGFLLTRF